MNGCGIFQSHAYSIIDAFTMTDSRNNKINALLVRNPWGKTGYFGDYNAFDTKWTHDMR